MNIFIPTWVEWLFWPGLIVLGGLIAALIIKPHSGGDYDFFSPLAWLIMFLAWCLAIAIMAIIRVAYF